MSKNTSEQKIIELINVSKEYDDTPAVSDVNLYVKKGEFITFLGPSGCGKTTTLRMIAGFELPTTGKILLNGEDITSLPPHKRPVNTVFQRYALFPHLNVFENIAYGIKLKKVKVTYEDTVGNQIERIERYTKEERALITISRTNEEKEFYLPREYQNKTKTYTLNKSKPGYLSPYGGIAIKKWYKLTCKSKVLQVFLGLSSQK